VLLDSQGNSKKKTIWLTTLQEIEKFINN
jgi:hypothetical protein